VESLGHEYVISIKPVEADIDRSILQERLTAMLSTFFGALSLLLGAIGLYGLTAYNVTQRIPEIGVRLALGAPRSAVQWMVLRETLLLALVGVAIGVPGAVAAARFIASMLFGLSAHDPVTMAIAVATLLAAAALAGFVPSRRAMRVDPIIALRHE
jgi:ABC-type antimicrobial peptide transport system permease subunit